jgi:hypothetical protein
LHEWVFTKIDEEDIHYIMALFGVEYALNIGERTIDRYRNITLANPGQSSLYPNGIDFAFDPFP